MTLLLDLAVPRTLDLLIERLERMAPEGLVEAWLFEDAPARRQAERRLADRGITARLRNAYKPLVHFVMEEVDLAGLDRALVRYPVHPAAPQQRFLMEAYPLAPMLAGRLRFEPGTADLAYGLTLAYRDGRTVQHRVQAPNQRRQDHLGATVLAPTGWLRVFGALDERLETELEAIFQRAMDAVTAHRWGRDEPYFEVLEIAATVSPMDRALPVGEERSSTVEALHEDLYFSLLEHFQRHSGRPVGDRGLQPGQIVPDIRGGQTPHLRVATRPFDRAHQQPGPGQPLESASAPLSLAQIEAELAGLGGRRFDARSRQGRPVPATLVTGDGPPVLISAGQHANEPSGIVGALRAARRLKAAGSAFALVPLENPDGYALAQRLCAAAPRHMQHAARYSALGDDIEARAHPPWLERAARMAAISATGSRLHINLHGYPAHEWTRPFTGYAPRGFESWSIPKGFFLIMDHWEGLAAQAQAFTQELARRLADAPELMAFNRRQQDAYLAHGGAMPFPVHHGIPCRVTAFPGKAVPFTLITEFPDETVYDDAFRLAHETQMRATLIAVELYRAGWLDPAGA